LKERFAKLTGIISGQVTSPAQKRFCAYLTKRKRKISAVDERKVRRGGY